MSAIDTPAAQTSPVESADRSLPAPAASSDLRALVHRLRELPGVRSKAAIGVVSEIFGGVDWWAGPGDDGAVVVDEGRQLIVGGEAMLSAFVEGDPYGAGIGAIVANVNDLAAMGAVPLAIVDTVVGPTAVTRQVLEGLRWASQAYGVPVVGGHLTESDGPPALSAFGLGRAEAVLSANHAAAGQVLVLACCLEGDMREDFLFFRSIHERTDRLGDDVRIFAEVAATGAAVAAKDVSMAGMIGSLAMLLEANQLGVEIDLDAIPVPQGVEMGDWLSCFPTFAFLLTAPADRVDDCVGAFTRRGLTAQALGTLDASGEVRLRDDSESAVVFDLTRESITRLERQPSGDGPPDQPGWTTHP